MPFVSSTKHLSDYTATLFFCFNALKMFKIYLIKLHLSRAFLNFSVFNFPTKQDREQKRPMSIKTTNNMSMTELKKIKRKWGNDHEGSGQAQREKNEIAAPRIFGARNDRCM